MDHDKMMQAIHDIFDPSLPRLAPGDEESTRHALQLLYGADLETPGRDFRVLDIGCGNGAQTLRLATELGCPVLAVDNHQPYLDELERRAAALGLSGLIETRCADMTELDLGGETFDLVWAEGSAFIVGIPEALRAWRSFLKPGGALGFSELVWLENDVPRECREFFEAEYPPMTDVAGNLAMIEAGGYDLAGYFVLPESSWREPFYVPLAKRLEGFGPLKDKDSQAVLEMVRREIEINHRYSRWYSYGFFLLRV